MNDAAYLSLLVMGIFVGVVLGETMSELGLVLPRPTTYVVLVLATLTAIGAMVYA